MSPERPGRDTDARRQLILRVSESSTQAAPAPSRPLEELEPGAAQALLVFVETLLTVGSVSGIAELLLRTAVMTYGFPRGAVLSGEKLLVVLAGHALLVSQSRSGSSATVTDANALQQPREVNGLEPAEEPLLGSLFPTGSELVVAPWAICVDRGASSSSYLWSCAGIGGNKSWRSCPGSPPARPRPFAASSTWLNLSGWHPRTA